MNLLKLPKNEVGKDFVIGDIHGNFSGVKDKLREIGFEKSKDRLISVDDLVDRGAESHHVLEWLDYEWFYPVQGNHENMAIRFPEGRMDEVNYAMNGGIWFLSLPEREQKQISDALSYLPLAIEVETNFGRTGIVHAEVPSNDWLFITETMNRKLKSTCQWGREKISSMDEKHVSNIDRVFVGHTPVDEPVKLGNVMYIDTAGWHNTGYFTVVRIQ